MLAIPPFGASSNIALWRANIKPPVELVVDDLNVGTLYVPLYQTQSKSLRGMPEASLFL